MEQMEQFGYISDKLDEIQELLVPDILIPRWKIRPGSGGPLVPGNQYRMMFHNLLNNPSGMLELEASVMDTNKLNLLWRFNGEAGSWRTVRLLNDRV